MMMDMAAGLSKRRTGIQEYSRVQSGRSLAELEFTEHGK